MSDENDVDFSKKIIEELRRTRSELLGNLHGIERSLNLSPARSSADPRQRLAVSFSKTNDGRKPYVMQIAGLVSTAQKLSPIRTAILLVLLLDLEDRSDGGKGIADPLRVIVRTYVRLESGAADDKRTLSNVRVALYRFDIYCQEEQIFSGKACSLDFDAGQCRLRLNDADNKDVTAATSIEISTDDGLLSEILTQTLAASPVAQVRKRGALYIPPSSSTYDRLIFDLFDHEHPIRNVTLSTRFSTLSYPLDLLEAIGASDLVIKRKKLADIAAKAERFSYLEIVNKSTLWDLIRCLPDGSFQRYPSNIQALGVQGHLRYLIDKVREDPTYQLVLTDTVFPFLIGIYDIKSSIVPEGFTVFFSQFGKGYLHDWTCFVVQSSMLNQSIMDSVVPWVFTQPSTIRVQSEVIGYIEEVLQRLVEEGPLESACEHHGSSTIS